jgi:toxin ParE1/3/4
MNGDQGFRLHPGAAQDITEIWEYIAADNPLAAQRVLAEILDAFRRLASFPGQGYRRPDLTSKPLRFLTLRSYVIAYASEQVPPLVLAVIHGRRSPRIVAATLRARE